MCGACWPRQVLCGRSGGGTWCTCAMKARCALLLPCSLWPVLCSDSNHLAGARCALWERKGLSFQRVSFEFSAAARAHCGWFSARLQEGLWSVTAVSFLFLDPKHHLVRVERARVTNPCSGSRV